MKEKATAEATDTCNDCGGELVDPKGRVVCDICNLTHCWSCMAYGGDSDACGKAIPLFLESSITKVCSDCAARVEGFMLFMQQVQFLGYVGRVVWNKDKCASAVLYCGEKVIGFLDNDGITKDEFALLIAYKEKREAREQLQKAIDHLDKKGGGGR